VRLRQAVLVAGELEPVATVLRSALGLGEPFRDPGVGEFGLANTVFALGDCFLEVVCPTRGGTAAGRYLERHGGDGGYMVIFDLEDLEGARSRALGAGVRVVWQLDLPDISGTHLHPADMRGAIVSLDRSNPYGSWRWGGPEWTGRTGTGAPGGLVGVTIAVADPPAVAARWGEVLGVEVRAGEGAGPGGPTPALLPLDGGEVRFEEAASEHGEGLVEIAVELPHDLPDGADAIEVGGVRLRRVRVPGHRGALAGELSMGSAQLRVSDELPLGEPLDWRPAMRPGRESLRGRHVLLRPVDPARDAEPLYALSHPPEGDPSIWTYLPDGPYESAEHLREALAWAQGADDAVYFTLVGLGDERPLGMAAYLRIEPESGAIEIGHIWFGAPLKRTTAATEAIFLLAAHAFEDLGYRRVEWKCNALNAASRRAAERFGFEFEGVFLQHMVVKGRNRDTAWYAITDRRWPAIGAGFRSWLAVENFDAEGRQRHALAELLAGERGRA
jgi:RimJ/RimL family protein N-acetyltransferase